MGRWLNCAYIDGRSYAHELPARCASRALHVASINWGDRVNKNLVGRFIYDDRGQDLIEYALLAGFISLVAVVSITAVGTGVNGVYNSLDSQVRKIPGGS